MGIFALFKFYSNTKKIYQNEYSASFIFTTYPSLAFSVRKYTFTNKIGSSLKYKVKSTRHLPSGAYGGNLSVAIT